MDNMTPADVMAMTRNDGNDSFFGANGFFGIIVLFFIFAMFGGGGIGGWGGNNAAAQGALTRAELADGFNTAEIQRNQSDIIRDQFGLQQEIMNNRFALADTANGTQREIMQNRFENQQIGCNTQKEILQNRYDNALAIQNLQAQMAQCCCETKTAIHAEGEATRSLMQSNTIQELRDQLQAAQLQLGTLSQTNTIIGTLRPTPVPAYITCSPYQNEPYNSGAYGGCCGR